MTRVVAAAVIAIAGLMLAGAPPTSAAEYDWYWRTDNWESSRDEGGWDALVLLGYTRGDDPQDYWLNAEFEAYGEHLYVYNATERSASVTLSVQEFAEYVDWVSISVHPGECIIWGWETIPSRFSHCSDFGDRNIPEDSRVIINACAQDPIGWTCQGEVAES